MLLLCIQAIETSCLVACIWTALGSPESVISGRGGRAELENIRRRWEAAGNTLFGSIIELRKHTMGNSEDNEWYL